ncbi:APC family permease [Fangia hongkongensis]|uniref:APC family permease n=1 Tax=Fangia hongkongensis TaxID=270495 RepID=UPI00039F4A48|nr:APC family permease [Fangia hongkongensis]MBK2124629.1 amino acid permease [Fangia hongkongensis]
MEITSSKSLTLLRLVMINIIAVDSLRNISITAQAGWVVVTFYVIAAIFFLLPCALLTAQMATGYTKNGGIYLWTKEAFGAKFGFVILWLQWIYNLVWFPSICGFFAGIIAYIIAPSFAINPNVLVNNPWYMISMSLGMFWLATIVNLRGIKTSSTLSVIGAVVGTLIPMFIIIALALFWVSSGGKIANIPNAEDFIPSVNNISSWGLFLTVMFSLFGLEMSSIHAGNVKNPRKNFPKALMISATVILLSLILSNIAIFAISSNNAHDVDIITGLMASFSYFFAKFHIPWMSSIIALTLILGAFTTVSAWIMGLSRAFCVAAEDKLISKRFAMTNKYGAPSTTLMLQGLIFSLFCMVYLLMPSVNSAYWFLSALTAQLAVIAYIGMFVAAVVLRKRQTKTTPNQFVIKGGIFSTAFLSALGIIGAIIAIIVGFIPTDDVSVSTLIFDSMLVVGIILSLIIPLWIIRSSNKNKYR